MTAAKSNSAKFTSVDDYIAAQPEAVQAALENFDFRGAEAATRRLAATLNLSLGAE